MSTPAAVTDFLSLARKSGVLDEKKLQELYPQGDELPRDPHACAMALIRAGLLTNFQAQQLLAGKYRGFVLGAYKVLQPIGKGGMGAVFLGEHMSLKRKVALKVLPADKATEKLSLERFQREARASAALDHPNIVRLHDISQGCGVHFLVLEYVDGTDLQSLMAKTGPLHYAQAAQYIAQAAAGLQHAHEKGFVHRDIKPANLMLAKDGTVKILDMGLTRSFLDEGDNLTGLLGDASDVAGTADYIAPEQAMNKPIDERSDVYSLGATLFALVTGHPPFKGSTAQKLMQHQVAEPPNLCKLRGVIPPALGEVVAKMMAKKPSERYQSAAEVIDALGPWMPAPTTGNIVQDPFSTQDIRVSRSTTNLGSAPATKADMHPPSTSSSLSAPASNGKLYALIGGSVAAAVVLSLGLAAALGAFSNSKPDNVVVSNGPPPLPVPDLNKGGMGGTTGTRPTPPPNRPPVTVPARTPRTGSSALAVSFGNLSPATMTYDLPERSMFVHDISGTQLPDGVHINHWNAMSSATYMIADYKGTRALGFQQTKATQGPQVHWKIGQKLTTLNSGDLATARISYALDGVNPAATFIEVPKEPYPKTSMTPLTPTRGEWQTIDVSFVRPPEGPDYDLVFRTESADGGMAADGTLWIRSVEIFEGPAPSPSWYRADFASVAPFQATISSRGVDAGTAPKLPAGWRAEVWNMGSEGQFQGQLEDGRMILSVSASLDRTAAQYAFDPKQAGLESLVPNREYEARFELRADEGITGSLAVQNVGGSWTQIARVGVNLSPGEWKTVSVPFKLEAGQSPQFTVAPSILLPGKYLSMRSFEIVDLTPGSPTTRATTPPKAPTLVAGPSIYALDLSKVTPFKSVYQDGMAVDADWGTRWPATMLAQCWKKESVAEFRAESTDKGPAVGVTNLNDAVSSQMLFQPESANRPPLETGSEYLVRVVYKTTNDATGKFWARLPGPEYTNVANVDLVGTSGAWRTVEFPFRREDKPIELGLENTAVGEGNTLLVQSVEVFKAMSPAAPASNLPYELNLQNTQPIVVKRKFRDTTDLARTGSGTVPAGWRSHSWEASCEHEVFCEVRDGQPVIGLRFVSGKAAGMLAVDGILVQPNSTYQVIVEYQTPGDLLGGEVRFRSSGNGGRLAIAGKLPATNGQWVEESYTIRTGIINNLQLEFHHNGPGGEQNPLLIRKLRVVPAP